MWASYTLTKVWEHRHCGRQRGRRRSSARPGLPRAPHRSTASMHFEAGPGNAPILTGSLPWTPLPRRAPRFLQVDIFLLTLACWAYCAKVAGSGCELKRPSEGWCPGVCHHISHSDSAVGGGWTGGWEAGPGKESVGGWGPGPLAPTGGHALKFKDTYTIELPCYCGSQCLYDFQLTPSSSFKSMWTTLCLWEICVGNDFIYATRVLKLMLEFDVSWNIQKWWNDQYRCTRLGVEWFLCEPKMTNCESGGPNMMQYLAR